MSEYLLFDVYYNELTTVSRYPGGNYSAGYLPIYKQSVSALGVLYDVPSTNQKLLVQYSIREIETFGYSIVQKNYLKQYVSKPENLSIEHLRVSEEIYNKLIKIAKKNDYLPIDKRIKLTLKNLLNLKMEVTENE